MQKQVLQNKINIYKEKEDYFKNEIKKQITDIQNLNDSCAKLNEIKKNSIE